MSKKYGSLLGMFLKDVGNATGYFKWPLEYSESWRYEQIYGSRKKMSNTVSYLKKRGLVKLISKNGQKFLQLTEQGQLEMLVQKIGIKKQKTWDGKWRLFIFDIPEDVREKRDLLRSLLKRNNFIKLQASVFISPYPLNREAIEYLKVTGLTQYIRILKVDEMDDDTGLRKKFNI